MTPAKPNHARTTTVPPDDRELFEVVRGDDGRLRGILRPPVSDLSEKVLALAHGAGTREGYRAGAVAGAGAAAEPYIKAGWEAGYAAGWQQGWVQAIRAEVEFYESLFGTATPEGTRAA